MLRAFDSCVTESTEILLFPMILLTPCSDTVSRSGMFCAIVTTIERCKTEGVVDVFQVVKALRLDKPGAVPSVVSLVFSFMPPNNESVCVDF